MTWRTGAGGGRRAVVVAACGVGLTFLVWVASGLGADSGKGRATVTETDICTLSAHPERFKGRLVRFRARIWVGVEGADLSDASSKCLVGLSTPIAVEDDQDIKQATSEAMDALKNVVGTLTGKLVVRRVRHRLVPILEAIKITNLEITPVKIPAKP